MRSLLPLFAALAITAAASSTNNAGSSTPSPALLVLRAACPAHDSTAFDVSRLRQHAATAARSEPLPPLRVLTYLETCAPGWPEIVTREALVVLGEGGTVECSGWPGATVCEALSAAARALHRPQPAACAVLVARASAVVELASKLHWTLALVPPAPPNSECAAALREVARALVIAGLTVRPDLIPSEEFNDHSYVVILCTSFVTTWAEAINDKTGNGMFTVLLLQIDELSSMTHSVFLDHDVIVPKSSSALNEIDPIDIMLSTLDLKSISPKRSKGLPDTVSVDRDTLRGHVLIDGVPMEKYVVQQIGFDRKIQSNIRESPTPLKEIQQNHVLLLTEHALATNRMTKDIDIIYAKTLEAIDRANEGERSHKQTASMTFPVYVGTGNLLEWSSVAILATESTRSLDETGEWVTSVVLADINGALERWRTTTEQGRSRSGNESTSASAAGVAIGACGAVILAAGGALAARWIAIRRRRRRRRADVVLTSTDFTFPVDERRRVGEGMETMLSCWLQQLHEFGGPELERPDLLKRPAAAPRVPSAPSSTCSINRVTVDRRTRYKGDAVHLKYLPVTGTLELKRKATDVLLTMQNMRHENINLFIGCLSEVRPALVFDLCWRGSLEDVLMADDIKLDWTFRLSLLTDLVKGMRYLHASPLRVHGRLSSRNCVVDSRWVLRVTDYGMPAFHSAQALHIPQRAARELLWTAPELLREVHSEGVWRATQPGDVFSFGIIMQEVIVRGEPYCMLAFSPEEIVEKVSRPPPLIRPSVSMGAAPPDAVSVMRQCWSEPPDLRPDFNRLYDVFRHMHRGRKINIVDSMFEMLEKYSNNLEELIKERTEQLDMEKKKTEQLLNRMLPRSVAERLMLGSRVEPEEFEEVSIYFSDIVGFTALAARSTPVQVVDLLNDLYTTFDAAIEQYRVYKVETIGDAYMVVGGLPSRTHDHAESIATMALHLLHLAGRFRVRHLPDTPLHLRIGLHSGPCCAGVVGLTMPRYCLFGDTVNTASRMESTGAAWRIQVSIATADLLVAAGGYQLCSRGLMQIKGKGAMHTYWLLGKEGFDRPLPTPPPLESDEMSIKPDIAHEVYNLATLVPPAQLDRSSATDHYSPEQSVHQASCSVSVRSHSGSPVTSASPAAPVSPTIEPRCRPLHSVSVDHSAPYARYRWLPGGARALRRQWSLERGDLLPAVGGAELAAASPAPPASSAAPRYRTRRDAPAPEEEAHAP